LKNDAIILKPNQVEAEWYSALIDDCQSIIIEAWFTHNWALVEGYHAVGKRILEENKNFTRAQIYGQEICSRVSISLGKSRQTINRAIQFAKKFPDLSMLPEGKDTTWHRICNKYLVEHRDPDPEPPKGKYRVIVIDPPWPIEKIERDCRPNQHDMDYRTMTLEEIEARRPPAAADAHLWLWTTHRFLPDAIGILERWGAKYICTFVWHKPGGFQVVGLPQYNCEFAVYGRIGSPEFSTTKGLKTCFNAARGGHSEKPEEFYTMIRTTTAGPRIDMYSRRVIKGFDAWGQEAPKK
jgi:N6-adenosine-specific RNA methylase IME4